jgi:hypothetical protein
MKRHIEGVLWVAAVGLLYLAALDYFRPYLLPIAILWIGATVTVIPLHFYRAWKKFSAVPNRGAYAAWVGFETLATAALIALGVYSMRH